MKYAARYIYFLCFTYFSFPFHNKAVFRTKAKKVNNFMTDSNRRLIKRSLHEIFKEIQSVICKSPIYVNFKCHNNQMKDKNLEW